MKCCGCPNSNRPPTGSWLVLPLVCLFVMSMPVAGARYGVGSVEIVTQEREDKEVFLVEVDKRLPDPIDTDTDHSTDHTDHDTNDHTDSDEHVDGDHTDDHTDDHHDDHTDDHHDDHTDDHHDEHDEHSEGTCFLVDGQTVNSSAVDEILHEFDLDFDGMLNEEEFDGFYDAVFGGGHEEHGGHRRLRSHIRQSFKRKAATVVQHTPSLRSYLQRQRQVEDEHHHEEDEHHHEEEEEGCHDAEELFHQYDVDGDSLLSPEEILLVSSELVMMVVHECGAHHEEECEPIDKGDAWLYGMMSVLGISLLSTIGVVLIPIHSKKIRDILIDALVSFAVGTLVGDVILHIIPEIFGVHSHGPEEEEEEEEEGRVSRIQWVGLTICAGVLFFMILDLIIHGVQHHFRHSKVHDVHSMEGDSPPTKQDPCLDCEEVLPPCRTCEGTIEAADRGHAALEHDGAAHCDDHTHTHTAVNQESPSRQEAAAKPHPPKLVRRLTHAAGLDEKRKKYSEIKTIGWLNLFSDGIHNFIDGITLGIAWSTSSDLGLATTIAIILHEVPQELGDFGILIHAGFTKWQAILWNLASALLSILGCIIGLGVGTSSEEAVDWLLAIAAGGFLYIALASMLPEVLKSIFESPPMIALSLFCVSLGFAVMFIIAVFEDTHC